MKPLPDVCLAPYEAGELAPDEPLCAPATHRVRSWLLFGSYLVRSAQTINGGTEFIARPEWLPDSPAFRFSWLRNQNLEQVVEAIRKGEFARSLYFDSRGHLASSPDSWQFNLWITVYGRSFWNSRAGMSGEFRWQGLKPNQRLSRVWRFKTPHAQIERDVREMLGDADSDCSFAWRWVQLSLTEQEQMLFPVGNGTQEEFRYFLSCVAWTDPWWDDVHRFSWCIEPPSSASASDDEYRIAAKSNVSVVVDKNEERALTPRLARWIELLFKHFKLSYSREVAHYTLIHQVWNWDGVEWRVAVPEPTQHECIEAHLRLREWLQGKVAPDEIPALLGEG